MKPILVIERIRLPHLSLNTQKTASLSHPNKINNEEEIELLKKKRKISDSLPIEDAEQNPIPLDSETDVKASLSTHILGKGDEIAIESSQAIELGSPWATATAYAALSIPVVSIARELVIQHRDFDGGQKSQINSSSDANNIPSKKENNKAIESTNKPIILKFNAITDDNILNFNESQGKITISGIAKNAQNGDRVQLQVGKESLQTLVVNETFTLEVAAGLLTPHSQITGQLTTQDSVGNQTTVKATHQYQVKTVLPQPVLTFNAITEDNILNFNESQGKITISGIAKNAQNGDRVQLQVGTESLQAAVVNEAFALEVAAGLLTPHSQITGQLTTQDNVGNQATVKATHQYQVKTALPQPVLTFNAITEDNILNFNESRGKVTISGQAKNAQDGDLVQLQIGTHSLQATVANQTFAVEVEASLLTPHSQITGTLTTQDNVGNQATVTADHHYQVLPIFTTTIFYPNEQVVFTENSPFNLEQIRYSKGPLVQQILNDVNLKARVIKTLEDHIKTEPEKINQYIEQSYQQDRDHDGVIDRFDKNLEKWDVSERDLRFFATSAHSSENVLRNVFERYKTSGIDSFNQQRLDNNADINEINRHWEMLKFVKAPAGLEYVIFGNGKQNNQYDNIVIAFRGTNNISDWAGNLNILNGQRHPQLAYLEQAAQDIEQYQANKIYATGNSLGGYLAQYFTAYTMQSTPERASKIQHSSLFNPAILNVKSNSSPDLKQARLVTDEFVKQSWIDDSDVHNPTTLHKTNSYVIQGEWLSSGYLVFNGLGSYDPSIFFDIDGSALEKHKMNKFYSKNENLKAIFSKGYRIDNHYLKDDSDNDGLTDQQEAKIGTHHKNADSDNDGFNDLLEIALKSDPLSENSLPDFINVINLKDIFAPISVDVKMENSQGQTKEKTFVLQPKLENETLTYMIDDASIAEYTAYFMT